MAKRFIEESTLTDIADAIREKKGSSELLDPADFASEVRGIEGDVLPSPLPIEVSTEAEMNALLETAPVGAVYKYVGGTTAIYESGGLYLVEVSE